MFVLVVHMPLNLVVIQAQITIKAFRQDRVRFIDILVDDERGRVNIRISVTTEGNFTILSLYLRKIVSKPH